MSGEIVGIIIAVVLLCLGCIAGGVFYLIRRRKLQRQRKILQDSAETFLARLGPVEKLIYGSDTAQQPLLSEPWDTEALDHLPKRSSFPSSPAQPTNLVPIRRARTPEQAEHQNHPRSRDASPGLRPHFTPSSSSSSSSSSMPTPPSSASLTSPQIYSSPPRKSSPLSLPPLIIPSGAKPAVTPSTYSNQRPVATIEVLSSAAPVNPPSIPKIPGPSQLKPLPVPSKNPFASASVVTNDSNEADFDSDTASAYSQASAWTQAASRPWEAKRTSERFSDAAGAQSNSSTDLKHRRGSTRDLELDIDINAGSSTTKNGLRLPPPPETLLDEEDDPLYRSTTKVGRLLKARAQRQQDSGVNLESEEASLSRNVSRIERENSIMSVRSVATVEDHKGSYVQRARRARENRMERLEESSETSTSPHSQMNDYLSPPLHNSLSTKSSSTSTSALSKPRNLPTPPSLSSLTLPNPFENLPSPPSSPVTTIGTTGTSGVPIFDASSFPPNLPYPPNISHMEYMRRTPEPTSSTTNSLPSAYPIYEDGNSDRVSLVPDAVGGEWVQPLKISKRLSATGSQSGLRA